MIGTRLLDRYELSAELGRGGRGVVYRARDPVLHREVAVKLISTRNLALRAEERFRREARTVAAMDHPAIVPIYDFGRQDEWLFFVMPLVRGTLLRALIRDGSLTVDDTLAIAIQVAEALDYSHARGIVHGDVKPSNVMISRQEGNLRARVLDFGLARRPAAGREADFGKLQGTLAYLSPELVTSGALDGRSDVYALGVMIYECLAGKPPFSGSFYPTLYRIAHQPPPPLGSWGAEVDPELEEIVLRCLAKDPAARPQQGRELAAALAAQRGKVGTGAVPATLAAPRGPGYQRFQLPMVGREAELAELERRLDAALSGECQLVVVGGGPGVGKRRLVQALESVARARGVRILRSRFSGRAGTLPYQGLWELVLDALRGRESDPDAMANSVDLSDLAPDLLALDPVFAEIEALRAAAEGHPRLAGDGGGSEASPTRIFELLATTLIRLAAGRPLVLVLGELHLARSSIPGLEYLTYRLSATPTLIVGTYRPTELGKGHPLTATLTSLAGYPRFCALSLGPLGSAAFRRLAEILIGSSELADELVRELWEATEGNPLFVRELIRSLLDGGAIQRQAGGTWALAAEAGVFSHALPATIQQAVEQRIEGLPERCRQVLSTASVLGKSFDYRDLEALVESGAELEETIDLLIDRELLVEDRKSRGDRLSFASAVVRETLYQRLSRPRRRTLHRRHAAHLERRHAGRLDRVLPQLVHHFSHGEVADRAVACALELARQSLRAASPEAAIEAAETALELIEDGDDAVLGELLELLAEGHRRLGRTGLARRQAERAAAAFERAAAPAEAAAAALLAAETAWQGREIDAARRWVARGAELARRGGAGPTLRRLLILGARVANLGGEYQQAREHLAEAGKLAGDGSPDAAEEPLPAGGTLIATLPHPVASVDPGKTRTIEDVEVETNVFETLLAADPEGNLAPCLCTEWEGAADGRRFELTLRPGVRFSDGTPLTGGAVKASFERSARLRWETDLAVFAAIDGYEEYVAGRAEGIGGIEVGPEHVVFRLSQPLPIFLTLLADPRTAVARVAVDSPVVGTGPFCLVENTPERVVLERNPRWWGPPPPLERIELLTSLAPTEVAAGLGAGTIDLGRELPSPVLEEILRDPRWRSGLVEATKKNVYFLVFNLSGPIARNPSLRRALTGVVGTRELVWRTLGRFADPAAGLIPPGILGHDPGRRQRLLTRDAAQELILGAGLSAPIRLSAAVYPFLEDRCAALLEALYAEWSALGVEVANRTPDLESFVARCADSEGIDLWIGRWHAEHLDPDTFSWDLFHSRSGIVRSYFSSPAADRLLEAARQERASAARERLYHRFEELLAGEGAVLALFHDVDYRIVGPAVRGLRLQATPPFVNYTQLAKVEEVTARGGPGDVPRRPGIWPAAGGEIRVATPARVRSLDPRRGKFVEDLEVIGVVFETLSRIDEAAGVVPWLAASIEALSGSSFRLRLRPGVRFHDGRRLTTRDVRHSFERLLAGYDREIFPRPFRLPVRGAGALSDGSAAELAGIRILSPSELVVELERPLALFPALLAHPCLAIVPEGSQEITGSWRDGCAGTGPFRVVRLNPGERLDLERNPHYWRPGRPKSDRLTFHLGVAPERIFEGYRQGWFSLASDLRPADAELLRRDPERAGNCHESPRLCTYFLALNARRGPLRDAARRHALAAALDVDAALRETIGHLVIPASGLIPPGLLGHEGLRESPPAARPGGAELAGLKLRAAVHAALISQYGSFWERLLLAFEKLGVVVEVLPARGPELIEVVSRGAVDLAALRLYATYPDVDSIVNVLLHSQEGWLGKLCSRPEIDQVIEDGCRETDPTLRHPIYRRIEETLARESLLIPLFYEQTCRFAQPGLQGLEIGLNLPEVRYEELSLAL